MRPLRYTAAVPTHPRYASGPEVRLRVRIHRDSLPAGRHVIGDRNILRSRYRLLSVHLGLGPVTWPHGVLPKVQCRPCRYSQTCAAEPVAPMPSAGVVTCSSGVRTGRRCNHPCGDAPDLAVIAVGPGRREHRLRLPSRGGSYIIRSTEARTHFPAEAVAARPARPPAGCGRP